MKKLIKKMIKNDINSYYNHCYVQWHITRSCTENCKHCYLKDKYEKSKFNIENSKKIIDQIYEISIKRKLLPYVSFTGGDPLLHEDLFEIIEYARSKNIIVSIKGNPRLLSSDIINKLKNMEIQNYHLSIDGLREIHDSVRSEGSFDITIDSLKKLKEAKIETLVKYTVSTINYKDMKEVMSILAEIGVDYFDFARFCPNSEDEYKYTFTPKEYKAFLLDVLKHYQDLKLDGYKLKLLFRDHLWMPLFYELGLLDNISTEEFNEQNIISGCSIGNNNCFVINYNGDVLPCAKLPKYILGNVFKDTMVDIINSEKFKKLNIKSSYKDCMNCKLGSICRGCPAISASVKKDMFLKDPQCWIEWRSDNEISS